MYTFINYIKYDIMHILHLIRLTHTHTHTYIHLHSIFLQLFQALLCQYL